MIQSFFIVLELEVQSWSPVDQRVPAQWVDFPQDFAGRSGMVRWDCCEIGKPMAPFQLFIIIHFPVQETKRWFNHEKNVI